MTALIVDGPNLLMRAAFAMHESMLSHEGQPTGPLMVFMNGLARHVTDEKPDRVVVCWDAGRSTRRTALLPSYKGERADPMPRKDDLFSMAQTFLLHAGVQQYGRVGVEADDLIAHYVRTEHGHKTIVSSDKDFLQLLEDTPGAIVEQVRLSSANTPTDRWTVERVEHDMGCHPRHLSSAMALAGDKVDGVPGIPGIGMKTAIKMLAKYDFDLALTVASEPRLAPFKDQVARDLQLVDLHVPEPGLWLPRLTLWQPVIDNDLLSFVRKYGLQSIENRMLHDAFWS
jgi:5'-3' exonuclease